MVALTTVEHFSAYRNAQHNLVAAETAPEPVEVAEITASAFAITNTPALLGRYLLPSDEADAASPVVVIGYQAWQLRFARRPQRRRPNGAPRRRSADRRWRHAGRIRIPDRPSVLDPAACGPTQVPARGGPLALDMFGRLAPGVTIEQAQAEFAAVAQRTAAAHPDSGLPLRPVVTPYTQIIEDPTMLWAMRAGQLFAGALTVVVAINLAILVYARTVTRLGEIAVRSALGASRRRILAQLFIEALALALVGAAAGLGLARYALEVIQTINETDGGLPYWINFELSPGAVMFALGLAVMSALIMGVLPGLKATGVGVSANLHELHGRSGTRLGATWTTLIVAQVAVAVAVLPAAVFIASRVIRMELAGAGFPVESIVAGYVGLGPDAPAVDRDRLAAQQRELLARLEAEPGVTGVAFSSGIPGFASHQSDSLRGRRAGARAGGTHPGRGHHGCVAAEHDESQCRCCSTPMAWRCLPVAISLRLTSAPPTSSSIAASSTCICRNRMRSVCCFATRTRARMRRRSGIKSSGWCATSRRSRSTSRENGSPPFTIQPASGTFLAVLLSVRFAGAVPPTFINRFRDIGAEVDPTLQLTDVGVMADLYRHAAHGVALARVGGRPRHGQRPAALGRRHLRVDVLHGRAAHTRDWHPHGAGRAATARDAERVRTRRVAGRPPASWWARCSRPASSWRSASARCAPCHSCWPWPRSWRWSRCWRRSVPRDAACGFRPSRHCARKAEGTARRSTRRERERIGLILKSDEAGNDVGNQ